MTNKKDDNKRKREKREKLDNYEQRSVKNMWK